MELLTIGHSNMEIEEFVTLLQQNSIKALADIRRFPGSRSFPQFQQSALSQSLENVAIEYCWLEALGGRRPKQHLKNPDLNAGLRNVSFRNYGDYMQTAAFRAGLEELLSLAMEFRTAMMCAESVYWRCHRRLVSDALVARGESVFHIFPDGKVRAHQLTPGAKIFRKRVTYPGPPTLFDK